MLAEPYQTDTLLIAPGELNAYDVLCNDWVVFTQDVLPSFNGNARPATRTESE